VTTILVAKREATHEAKSEGKCEATHDETKLVQGLLKVKHNVPAGA
jgi:hypothetical protein